MENWSTFATISYFCCYTILVVIISIVTYDPNVSKSKWIKAVWKRRAVYGAILIHIYDTATDIGVIIIWGELAVDELNGKTHVENVDMMVFFVLGLVFLVVYRIVTFIAFTQVTGCCSIEAILSIFDLAVIHQVYEAHKDNLQEPTEYMMVVQLAEGVTESVPQVMLQSVFLMRTYNNNSSLLPLADTILLILSVAASILSISSKYTRVDRSDSTYVTKFSQKLFISSKDGDINSIPYKCCCNFISYGYFVHVFWRFGSILSRVCVYSLLWTVLGGFYLAIYIPMEMIIIWIVLTFFISKRNAFQERILVGGISLGAVYVGEKKETKMFISRIIDDTILMIVVTVFSLVEFNCLFCHDANNRNFFKNKSIAVFIVVGWCSIGIYVSCFIVGLHYGCLKTKDIDNVDKNKVQVKVSNKN